MSEDNVDFANPMLEKTIPKLVLPIRHEAVNHALESSLDQWFDQAGRIEALTLYVISQIPKLASTPDKAPQKALIALTNLTKDISTPEILKSFREQAGNSVSKKSIKAGMALLDQLEISLDTPNNIDSPQPTKADGTLNPDYNTGMIRAITKTGAYGKNLGKHSESLNYEQTVASTIILGNDDDPVHIEGPGGTGKSHIIKTLLQSLPAKHTAILAKTNAQLEATAHGVDARVHQMLFGHFARHQLIINGVPKEAVQGAHTYSNFAISNETIARSMDLPPVGDWSPAAVAGAMMATLTKYCASEDDFIARDHLPNSYFKTPPAIKDQIVRFTKAYWAELTTPEKGERWQPLRHKHLIKWASLVCDGMPSRDLRTQHDDTVPDIRFVVVDEAHDLTPAMAALLRNTGVLVRSFSDTFQRLEGIPPKVSYTPLRNRIHQSMRAGKELEKVINPTLESHPRNAKRESVMNGNNELSTKLTFYDTLKIPNDPFAILCGSYFHVIEYVQRLAADNAKVSLLPGTEYSFRQFGMELIRMFNRAPGQITAYDLNRYRDWEALQKAWGNAKAFQRIERMLQKGYSEQDFANLLAKLSPIGRGSYIVARVEDSKNWQFPNVMLSKELTTDARNADFLSENISKVYLGLSRTQRSLAVGNNFESWLESVKRLSPEGK